MIAAFRTLAMTAAVLAAALPAAAIVQPGDRQTFRTELTDTEIGTAGAYEGTLNIAIAADGIVSGTYRPAGSAHEDDVTGGLQSGKIWLDIAGSTKLHLYGDLRNGAIVAYTEIGLDTYKFSATPVAPSL